MPTCGRSPSLARDENRAFSGITLTVRGAADGITAEEFAAIAQDAKRSCTVSKALAGTDISLAVQPRADARLSTCGLSAE